MTEAWRGLDLPMARESGVGSDHHEVLPSDSDDRSSVVRVWTEPPLSHAIVVVTQTASFTGDLLYSEGLHTGGGSVLLLVSAIQDYYPPCLALTLRSKPQTSDGWIFQNLNSFLFLAPRNDKHISRDRCPGKDECS